MGSNRDRHVPEVSAAGASQLLILRAEVDLPLPHVPVQTLGQALEPVVDWVSETDGGDGEAGSGDGDAGKDQVTKVDVQEIANNKKKRGGVDTGCNNFLLRHHWLFV